MKVYCEFFKFPSYQLDELIFPGTTSYVRGKISFFFLGLVSRYYMVSLFPEADIVPFTLEKPFASLLYSNSQLANQKPCALYCYPDLLWLQYHGLFSQEKYFLLIKLKRGSKTRIYYACNFLYRGFQGVKTLPLKPKRRA